MTFKSEIVKIENADEDAKITVANVRRVGAAEWRSDCPEIILRVPLSSVKQYRLERFVTLTVTPDR